LPPRSTAASVIDTWLQRAALAKHQREDPHPEAFLLASTMMSKSRTRWPGDPCRFSGARAGAIFRRNAWTERHRVDDPADKDHLSGLQPTPWTIGPIDRRWATRRLLDWRR
jgi:hypothetical protein